MEQGNHSDEAKVQLQENSDRSETGPLSGRRVVLRPRAATDSSSDNITERPFPFPRVFHWVPNRKEHTQAEAPFMILIDQEVLKRVNEHVTLDVKNEVGGFLLGKRYLCPVSRRPYIRIDNYSEAQFTSADDVSLHIDKLTWMQLHDELDGKYSGKELMGWYHSHPGHSVFLSSKDVIVHELSFTDDWMVALVVDPQFMTGGFFCRIRGTIDPEALVDFYEFKGLNSSDTFMPWKNHECLDGINNEPTSPLLAPYLECDAAPTPEAIPQDKVEQVVAEPEFQTPAPPTLFEKYKYSGLILLVLLLAGAYYSFGTFRRPESVAADNSALNSSAAPNPARGEANQPPGQATKPISTIVPSSYRFLCQRKKCKLKVTFDSRPDKLQARAADREIPTELNRENGQPVAILDVNSIPVIQRVISSPREIGNLQIVFVNEGDQQDSIVYPVDVTDASLHGKSEKPPPARPPKRPGQPARRDPRGELKSNKTTICTGTGKFRRCRSS